MLIRICLALTALTAAACIDDATASDTQASDPQASEAQPFDMHGVANRPHRPPPKEAVDACASAAAGTSCAFDINDHHVTGTCRQPDTSKPLVCIPAMPPPPPEAFAACAGSSAGATCAFDIDDHHIDGTCRTGPDGSGPLACAPAHPPGQ